MIAAIELAKLDDATRSIVEQLLQRIESDAQKISKRDAEINWRDAKIEKLAFEMAQLKRVQFGVKGERLNVDQQHLFEEAVSADLAAIEAELDELKASAVPTTQASSEKLDYEPGQFTVERHVRGKWACLHCKTLIQAPVPAEVINKGIASADRRLVQQTSHDWPEMP